VCTLQDLQEIIMSWFFHAFCLLALFWTQAWSAESALVPIPAVVSGVEYRVTRLNDQELAIGSAPTLMLDGEAKRASGFNGVNRYSGDYTVVGDVLTIGQSISTMMAADDASMKIEQDFMGIIALPLTITRQADDIVASNTKGTLRLVRQMK
jgi:heat shock protein HslJ